VASACSKLSVVGRRVIGLVLALALGATVGACSGDDEEGSGQTLKVGYSYGFDIGDTGDRVAFDRVAEQTEIEPEFEETGGGPEAIAALNRGDIDMAKLSFPDAINAIGQDADLRLILLSNPHSDLILVGGPEVKTLADLRGGQILLDRPGPSTSAATLPGVLEQAGLEEGDYEIGYLSDSQNRSAALLSGRTDATPLESTDIELARQDAEINELAELGSLAPEPANVFAVRSDFIEENRALLEDFAREMVAGYDSLYQPGGREIWIERAREGDLADQPEEVATAIYEAHRKSGYWPRRGPYSEREHQRAIDFGVEAGTIEEPVPFEEAWDNSFWSKAAEG
jgi:ABC-type nitrate/sulfonate/bicarbonate transport system substrate-binding protein